MCIRKCLPCVVVFFGAVLTPAVLAAYPYSDYTWKPYNGHEYTITFDYNNWLNAEAEAVAVGGHLATVDDANENAWLTDNFGGFYDQNTPGNPWASCVWIGLRGVPDSLSWASGEPVTYVGPIWNGSWGSWGGVVPVHAYLHPSTHPNPGTWYNGPLQDGSDPGSWIRGIIELDQPGPAAIPEPCSFVLWCGLGGVGLWMAWRRRRSA